MNETKKQCQSCKHWGLNRDLALNGIEDVHIIQAYMGPKAPLEKRWQAWCENDDVRNFIHTQETNLPAYITVVIKKQFVTPWIFGCTNWEEAEGWKALWI